MLQTNHNSFQDLLHWTNY